jgi:N-methylhydantoinase B/oxoprolinase/acetone carboxylase alpha subunit
MELRKKPAAGRIGIDTGGKLRPGDVLRVETPGGGGYGRPRSQPRSVDSQKPLLVYQYHELDIRQKEAAR